MQLQKYLILLVVVLAGSGCSKFLDKKPRSDIVEPASLSDVRAMLEIETHGVTPALPILSADEYYYRSYANLLQVTGTERNSYLWEKDVFAGETVRQDWQYPYIGIFYANNAMEAMEKMDSASTPAGKVLRGWALFLRAHNMYNLVKCFAKIYDKNTASTDPGIPIKLKAAIDDIQPRASVQAVYDQILKDLLEARTLLPTTLPANRNQPSVMATDALLARIGLTMQDYTMAERYADSCLSRYNKLIDYNGVSTSSAQPFVMNNDETLFATTAVLAYSADKVLTNTFISIDTVLLKMYNTNDIRGSVYYGKTGQYAILKRGYYGPSTFYPFTGIATDEVYLIKAECAARREAVDVCLSYLNQLLVKRYRQNTFTPLTASGGSAALLLTLAERRKELVWRGLRWDDLARLNKEGAEITLKRVVDGTTYTLAPNSPRYVFNIPADEIALSGIAQNER
ncbi:RagB/SusD family nutrient uptake outer membrane protein [Filimonas effusa]|uniref:RagB/SusD family nutrient uptake outer membrane protein n=1 Tax=Filimonas effusa TaxID=2508721 RepID=A0A4Q1D608_9BACT|nr:RagB/SusD family nutrient uptake outer membrane protein [Filimonas effusa]RXK83077.1 RagB/SusD family nutrient uptake outer membrane protein [Filimonas effusa]